MRQCSKKCENGQTAWRCARCWKDMVLAHAEPYMEYCTLPNVDCQEITRPKWTQGVNVRMTIFTYLFFI